jgi:hypothetical protein
MEMTRYADAVADLRRRSDAWQGESQTRSDAWQVERQGLRLEIDGLQNQLHGVLWAREQPVFCGCSRFSSVCSIDRALLLFSCCSFLHCALKPRPLCLVLCVALVRLLAVGALRREEQVSTKTSPAWLRR